MDKRRRREEKLRKTVDIKGDISIIFSAAVWVGQQEAERVIREGPSSASRNAKGLSAEGPSGSLEGRRSPADLPRAEGRENTHLSFGD